MMVFFAMQLIAADDFLQVWLSLQCLSVSSQALVMLWINPKGEQAVCVDSFEFWAYFSTCSTISGGLILPAW
jgi:hypothetical protein